MDIMHHTAPQNGPGSESAMTALIAQMPAPLAEQVQQAFVEDLCFMFESGLTSGKQLMRDTLAKIERFSSLTVQQTTPSTAPGCKPWCVMHDGVTNVCLGETHTLHFTAPDRDENLATAAHVQLSHCPVQGTDIDINVGRGGITMADADQLADLIKHVAAIGRKGGAQ